MVHKPFDPQKQKSLTALVLVGEVVIVNDKNWKVHSGVLEGLHVEIDQEVKDEEKQLNNYFVFLLILQRI